MFLRLFIDLHWIICISDWIRYSWKQCIHISPDSDDDESEWQKSYICNPGSDGVGDCHSPALALSLCLGFQLFHSHDVVAFSTSPHTYDFVTVGEIFKKKISTAFWFSKMYKTKENIVQKKIKGFVFLFISGISLCSLMTGQGLLILFSLGIAVTVLSVLNVFLLHMQHYTSRKWHTTCQREMLYFFFMLHQLTLEWQTLSHFWRGST